MTKQEARERLQKISKAKNSVNVKRYCSQSNIRQRSKGIRTHTHDKILHLTTSVEMEIWQPP